MAQTDVNGNSLAASIRVLIPGQTPRRPNEEAKGILSYRITDRRGDHFDHRRDCNSKLDALENGGERGICRGFDPYHQHGPGDLFDDLWHWLWPVGESGGAVPCTPSAATSCLVDALISGGTKS